MPIQETFARVLGDRANDFVVDIIPRSNGLDVFEIEQTGNKIALRGSSQNAIGYAMNWYLKYYCNRQVPRGTITDLPDPLPEVRSKVSKNSPYKYRYFLNYCTFNYTMSFYGWKDWEKELDWMALNGINLALAINGYEAVWQNTLKHFNITDKEIVDFIPGPAYQSWWLMGNLEGWGGPVSQQWIDDRALLQKNILGRMQELDIEPVLQGFYGVVPNVLRGRYPKANIIEGGNFNTFNRPAYLDPNDPLFGEMAAIYYDELKKLYGSWKFYGGDPFHEGGNTEGIDITSASGNIQKQMLVLNNEAVWVLQGWLDNPKPETLNGIDKDKVLILDLFADNSPDWQYRKGYDGSPWVWCAIVNFGSRTDLFGRLQNIANEPIRALKSPYGAKLTGIGAMPEGSSPNPVVYELVYEMAWQNEAPDLNKWIKDYSTIRYGKSNLKAQQAWVLLLETVYGCPRPGSNTDGCGESEPVICARPALDVKGVDEWGSIEVFYDTTKLKLAGKLLLEAASELQNSKNYLYDLVDVWNEIISNMALLQYKAMQSAYKQKDKAAFRIAASRFLDLIKKQDELTASNDNFLLGKWTEQARNIAPLQAEKELFEWNARTLITWWGWQNRNLKFVLHDYAYKEWSGLLSDYYFPRWEKFITNCNKELNGEKVKPIDFIVFEEDFCRQSKQYCTHAKGNTIEIIQSFP